MRTPVLTILTLTCLTCLTLTVLPTGTAGGSETDVTLTIDAPARLLALNEPFTITYTIGADQIRALNETGTPNMLDLLVAAATDLEFTETHSWSDFDGDGIAESAYVSEINGLEHLADGLVYAWSVLENGEYASTGANGVTVEPGDKLLFRYEGWLVPA